MKVDFSIKQNGMNNHLGKKQQDVSFGKIEPFLKEIIEKAPKPALYDAMQLHGVSQKMINVVDNHPLILSITNETQFAKSGVTVAPTNYRTNQALIETNSAIEEVMQAVKGAYVYLKNNGKAIENYEKYQSQLKQVDKKPLSKSIEQVISEHQPLIKEIDMLKKEYLSYNLSFFEKAKIKMQLFLKKRKGRTIVNKHKAEQWDINYQLKSLKEQIKSKKAKIENFKNLYEGQDFKDFERSTYNDYSLDILGEMPDKQKPIMSYFKKLGAYKLGSEKSEPLDLYIDQMKNSNQKSKEEFLQNLSEKYDVPMKEIRRLETIFPPFKIRDWVSDPDYGVPSPLNYATDYIDEF